MPNHCAFDCFHLEAGVACLREKVRAGEAGQEGGQAQGASEAQGTHSQITRERRTGQPQGGITHRQQLPQGRGQQPAPSQRRTTECVTCHRSLRGLSSLERSDAVRPNDATIHGPERKLLRPAVLLRPSTSGLC